MLLSLIATLQMARNSAPYHILRYKLTDEPLDYTIAFQAGFVMPLLSVRQVAAQKIRQHLRQVAGLQASATAD